MKFYVNNQASESYVVSEDLSEGSLLDAVPYFSFL